MMNQVQMRDCPIGRFFGTYYSNLGADKIKTVSPVLKALFSCHRMPRIVALIRRNNGKNIQICATDFDVIVKNRTIVLGYMSKSQTGAKN
jgi:hypothetical protein